MRKTGQLALLRYIATALPKIAEWRKPTGDCAERGQAPNRAVCASPLHQHNYAFARKSGMAQANR
jgi:hypothetical protein